MTPEQEIANQILDAIKQKDLDGMYLGIAMLGQDAIEEYITKLREPRMALGLGESHVAMLEAKDRDMFKRLTQ